VHPGCVHRPVGRQTARLTETTIGGIVPTLIEEYDRERAIVLKARWLMAGFAAALVGFFLTGPLGILRLVEGRPLGWALVGAAALFAAVGIVCFRASRARVSASGYRITADASQQADPEGTPMWARKDVGWTATAVRQWFSP
jgi:hypothetical protein